MTAARTVLPFSLQASVGCCAHGELALALAGEFGPVDAAAADRALDDLAAGLADWRHAAPTEQLGATAHELRGALRAVAGGPLDLAEALAGGDAHPLVWCVAGIEAARRAGIELGVVAGQGLWLLAHPSAETPVVADPLTGLLTDARRLASDDLHWQCSHQVALAVLDRIGLHAARERRYDEAIRALELALALPLDEAGLARLRSDLGRLRRAAA